MSAPSNGKADPPKRAGQARETSTDEKKNSVTQPHPVNPEPTDLTLTEENLLSCLMLPESGAATLQKCRDADLTAATFSRAEHSAIFRLIAELHDAGASSGIGDELIRRGSPYMVTLLRLTDEKSVQTCLHVNSYIADLKEAAIANKVQRVAREFMEAFCQPGAKRIELFHDFRGKLDQIELGTSQKKPSARSLMTLTASEDERRAANLLGNGFLRRGQGALLPGATGIGKSSLFMQALVLWALGKPFFGIMPQGPLTSLLVQAENDDIDLVEMRDGVCDGLALTATEREIIARRVFVLTAHERGAELMQRLQAEVQRIKPDLLVLDPLFAFMEGAVKDQEAASYFLRAVLQPFLVRHNLAAIILHHTNKPPSGKEKSTWQGNDFSYAGSGSIEFANWARAVILLRSIGKPDVFELMLPKRGKRAGITDASGAPITSVMIRHARTPGKIFWELADAADTRRDESNARSPQVVKAFFSLDKGEGVSLETLARRLRCSAKTVRRDLKDGKVKTDDGETLVVRDSRVFAEDVV